MFQVTTPNSKVYGSNQHESVIINKSATDTELDGNIEEIHFPWLEHPYLRSSGNKIEVFDSSFFKNGPLIATATYNERTLNLIFGTRQCLVGFNGGITVGGKIVSTVTPEAL